MKLSSVKVVETLGFFGRRGGGVKGKGVGEQRSVWAVIGCRLSFSLSHKHTQRQCPPTTLEGTDGEGEKIRAGDFVWDFPSAPYTQPSAISPPPPED